LLKEIKPTKSENSANQPKNNYIEKGELYAVGLSIYFLNNVCVCEGVKCLAKVNSTEEEKVEEKQQSGKDTEGKDSRCIIINITHYTHPNPIQLTS
jgi:hypothetical protein